MNNGLDSDASLEEIYSNPANLFTACFIGSPAMNIVALQGKLVKVLPERGISQEKTFRRLHTKGIVVTREMRWGVRRPIPCGIRWGEPIW